MESIDALYAVSESLMTIGPVSEPHSITLLLLFLVVLIQVLSAVVRAWTREAKTQFQEKAETPVPQPPPPPPPMTASDVERLLDRLGSPDAAEVKSADRELGEHFYGNRSLRGSDTLRPIIDMASRVDAPDVARGFCLRVVGSIQVPGAREILIKGLSAKSPLVRAAAAGGLHSLRDPTTVAPLVEVLLNDDSHEVRSSVTSTLGWIESPEAVPALMTCFERGDKRAKVDALHALGRIGDPRSLPLARAALSHRYRRLREAAKSALFQYDYRRRRGQPEVQGYLP